MLLKPFMGNNYLALPFITIKIFICLFGQGLYARNREVHSFGSLNATTCPLKKRIFHTAGLRLVNANLVVSYYTSLPQPIVYIINRKSELVEYRDGKAVDAKTVPYRTPFRPHSDNQKPVSPPANVESKDK